MGKTLLLTVICWLLWSVALAQRDLQKTRSSSDSIDVMVNFYGTRYYHQDKQLKLWQLRDLLQSKEQAFQIYNTSKPPRVAATIFSYVGGFLIGWDIGTAIAGGKTNLTLAGVGCGLVAVAIPFQISANRKLRKAVNAYNSGL